MSKALLCGKRRKRTANAGECHWSKVSSVCTYGRVRLMDTALATARHHHTLKYRTSSAKHLATVVTVAVNSSLDVIGLKYRRLCTSAVSELWLQLWLDVHVTMR